MITRTLILCTTCLALAGCATDKISMSSEVSGGGSGGAEVRSTGVSSILSPEENPITAEGGGLGITGDNGVVSNIVGQEPLGGVIEGALGKDNIVSQILGPSGGTGGLVPELAAAMAGDPDAVVLEGGLGIVGENGLIADLTGSDVGGAVLGVQGVIPASLAGGNDGLLGSLLGDHVANPVLGPVAEIVPANKLVNGLAQVPALGVTGQGGVVASLLGADLVGNLIGTGGALGGGSSGVIGSQLPQDSTPPLAPLGDVVGGVLNTVAGNAPSPLSGSGIGAVLNSLPGATAPSASPSAPAGAPGDTAGALASVPLIGPMTSQVLGGATGALNGPIGGALAPVTKALSGVPILGGLLSGH